MKEKRYGVVNVKKKEGSQQKRRRMLLTMKKHWRLYLLAAVPLGLVFLFSYVPMPGIIVAFKDFKFSKGIFGSAWNGLDNFKYFFYTDKLWEVLRNSIVLNLVGMAIETPFCILMAIIMFEVKSRRIIKFSQTVLFGPGYISVVVQAVLLYTLLKHDGGLINQILEMIGLETVQWYTKPVSWIGILNIRHLWASGGATIVLYYATLMGTDPGMYEAAEIDGANWWQKTRYITLPHLYGVICLLHLQCIGGIISGPMENMIYTKGSSFLLPTTDVTGTYSYRLLMGSQEFGKSAAFGLMFSIASFILVYVANAIVRKIEPDNALF